MKKFIKTALGLTVMVSLVLIPLNSVLASQIDQSNETGATADINILGHSGVCWQTFKPALPTFDYATVYLNNGGGNNAVIRIIRVSDNTTLMSSTVSVNGDSWYTVSGSSVSVTPGETLKLVVSTGSATMQWRWGANNYSNGEAYAPDVVPDKDFYFRTYGTPTSPTPTPSTSTSPTASPAPGSGIVGSAPSKNIDASIKAPFDLKAEDASNRDKNEPKIKLTWEASTTTGIEGYRIYNKTDLANDYALVAEINKETKEYTDGKVEFDKDYTYMVRAYKSDKESESSNEVLITVEKERRELKVFGYLGFAGPLWQQWQFWTLVALGLALIGFIIWYIISKRRAKKTQKITTESIKS